MPARIAIKFLLNSLLVWGMNMYLPEYLAITGGFPATVILGALLTLLNLLIRPLLNLLVTPLKLFATLPAILLANGVFLWLIVAVVSRMDPRLITLEIKGIVGWIVVALALGFANWAMKLILR